MTDPLSAALAAIGGGMFVAGFWFQLARWAGITGASRR